jgi:hypothetical protein
LEDDENSLSLSKPKKPSSKPPKSRPSGRKSTDDLEKKIHEDYEKEMNNIQNVITDQVARLKQQMIIQSVSQRTDEQLEYSLTVSFNFVNRRSIPMFWKTSSTWQRTKSSD